MTHKWNYRNPVNLWEKMPFWIRWPLAVLAIIYFGGAFLVPVILM